MTADNYDYFLNDARGIQIARKPENDIIGTDFAWRTYFTGRSDDMDPSERPKPGEHITAPHISAPYRSQATKEWIVSIAAPVYDRTPEEAAAAKTEPKFLGVVALMMPVGDFIRFEGQSANQFAALVDWRNGKHHGLVLQHPKLEEMLKKDPEIGVDRLLEFTVKELRESTKHAGRLVDYYDPVVDRPGSRKQWLAQMTPIPIGGKKPSPDDCLVVVVQEDYQDSIGATLGWLKQKLVGFGLTALALIVIVMIGLWTLAIRMFRGETAEPMGPASESPPGDSTTGSVGPSSTASATPLATPTEGDKK
jgi:eukaryotic-like serine/threonine-protein kinase